MSLFALNSKNIKFKLVDSDIPLESDDCLVEVIVKKSFLKDFLVDLLLVQDSSYIPEFPLTRKEKQVLKYLSSGKNNAQIASIMHVSIHTTKVHIHNIFNKLSVQDRTEAVVKAIKYKLIDI